MKVPGLILMYNMKEVRSRFAFITLEGEEKINSCIRVAQYRAQFHVHFPVYRFPEISG